MFQITQSEKSLKEMWKNLIGYNQLFCLGTEIASILEASAN